MAIIAFEARDFDAAETAFKENLQLVREIGNPVLEQSTLFELGIVALRVHRDLPEAQSYFEDSLKLADLLARRSLSLKSELYLAEIDQEQDKHGEAIDGFSRCVTLAQEIQDPEALCMALARRARSYALQMNLSAAKSDLERAYPIAQRLQSPFLAEITTLRSIVNQMMPG